MTTALPTVAPDASLVPAANKEGDAGYDVRSSVDIVVPAAGRVLVPVGLKIALPSNFVAMVCPRSGLAGKHGITVLNAPGIVDSGFRGELQVILANTSTEDFTIKRGDRIAQLVFVKFEQVTFDLTDTLEESERGEQGFGSSGVL